MDLNLAAGAAHMGAGYELQGQLPEALEWSLADGAFVDVSLKGVALGDTFNLEGVSRARTAGSLNGAPADGVFAGDLLKGAAPDDHAM